MIDQIGTLETILQASLVLLGFSGAVVALGNTRPSEWTGVNRMRIRTLIGASIVPLGLSAFLLILLHAGVETARSMQIVSIIAAAIVLYIAVGILKANLDLPKDEPDRISLKVLAFFQITGYATAALLIWNAFYAAEFWPILFSFVLGLMHGARMFARLLFRPV